MPEMRKEVPAGTISLNNVSIPVQQVTEGVQKTWRGNRIDDLVLESGAYTVSIINTDTGGGTILVNGRTITFGGEYNAKVFKDEASNRQDFCEEINITANGANYWLAVIYPSDHSFNPSTLD